MPVFRGYLFSVQLVASISRPTLLLVYCSQHNLKDDFFFFFFFWGGGLVQWLLLSELSAIGSVQLSAGAPNSSDLERPLHANSAVLPNQLHCHMYLLRMIPSFSLVCPHVVRIIGVSLSEPHRSNVNGDFV